MTVGLAEAVEIFHAEALQGNPLEEGSWKQRVLAGLVACNIYCSGRHFVVIFHTNTVGVPEILQQLQLGNDEVSAEAITVRHNLGKANVALPRVKNSGDCSVDSGRIATVAMAVLTGGALAPSLTPSTQHSARQLQVQPWHCSRSNLLGL